MKTRNEHDLYATILRAAKEGRGLRLSATETMLLAKQPFVAFDQRISALEWRTIEGYERYEISIEGHVRRGMRLLKQTETKSLHLNVTIYSNSGEQWRAGVHHLVATAFKNAPPADKPLACHVNGRPWDNRATNLYWGSHADNVADMVRHASLDSRRGIPVETAS